MPGLSVRTARRAECGNRARKERGRQSGRPKKKPQRATRALELQMRAGLFGAVSHATVGATHIGLFGDDDAHYRQDDTHRIEMRQDSRLGCPT
jgi:hypothetical protein